MSGFSFTSTAYCDYCGNPLESSDQECDECSPEERLPHLFRHFKTGEIRELTATMSYKWYALERDVGETWIAYEWLGTKERAQSLAKGSSLGAVPKIEMAIDAPRDVEES